MPVWIIHTECWDRHKCDVWNHIFATWYSLSSYKMHLMNWLLAETVKDGLKVKCAQLEWESLKMMMMMMVMMVVSSRHDSISASHTLDHLRAFYSRVEEGLETPSIETWGKVTLSNSRTDRLCVWDQDRDTLTPLGQLKIPGRPGGPGGPGGPFRQKQNAHTRFTPSRTIIKHHETKMRF